MSVVLAGIDNSAAARPVLDFARELARLLGAEVEAVHVDQAGAPRTAEVVADALHLRVHRRHGQVAAALRATAEERDAIALVIGARGLPAGSTPAGHVTLDLVQALDIPVAVVPPQANPGAISRILVAVEGDGESHALRHLLPRLRGSEEVEIVALHVFEPDELPMFGDQPVHETEAWMQEFRRRALHSVELDVKVEVRTGDAVRKLREAVVELGVDLVVLGWHRDLSHGHGRLVQSVLESSEVPMLLLPIGSRAQVRAD